MYPQRQAFRKGADSLVQASLGTSSKAEGKEVSVPQPPASQQDAQLSPPQPVSLPHPERQLCSGAAFLSLDPHKKNYGFELLTLPQRGLK